MAIGTIITADIVNSTHLPKAAFSKLIKTIASLIKPYKSEFYRGDSFQVYLKENDQALLLLLKIRMAAKRIETESGMESDVRAGIGIGTIKSPVRVLKTATDDAFILSGRLLDKIPQNGRLAIQTADDKANCTFRVIARFVDYILKDITTKQAAVIFELLMGSNQTDTAKKLKKSQVTVNRQVHAAGWQEINSLLIDYRIAIQELKLK